MQNWKFGWPQAVVAGLVVVAFAASYWLPAEPREELRADLGWIWGGISTFLGPILRRELQRRRSVPPLMLLAVSVVAAVTLAGCGGPPRAARVALQQTAQGLVVADQELAEAVRARGDEARQRVRAEAREGALAGDSPASLVAAGMARFEELMRPTSDARAAICGIRSALFGAEAALDAWQSGAADEVEWLPEIGCVLAVLERAGSVFNAANLTLPEALGAALESIGGLARSVCPRQLDDMMVCGGGQ